jgi:isochorismate synthase
VIPETSPPLISKPDARNFAEAGSARPSTTPLETLVGESAPVAGKSPWECLWASRDEIRTRPTLLWEAPDGEEIAGIGAVARISASGRGRFEDARRRIARSLERATHRGLAPAGFPGAIAVGGFAFAAEDPRGGWPGFADALFFIPERVFWRDPGGETIETRWSVSVTEPYSRAQDEAASPTEGLHQAVEQPDTTPGMDREGWVVAVRATLDRVREGSISKAVLARSVDLGMAGRPNSIEILGALRAAYPGCYRFLIADGQGAAFLGASPERLVRLVGGDVSTEAVAGTVRRGPDGDDESLARSLAQDSKERTEHEMVLRHLLETLRPDCADLHAPAHPGVMRLPHLLHLRTPVRGRARGNPNVIEIVSRLHPTPAVAGLKREEALAWIRSVEAGSRGWYAGPVGWVNARGEGDFAVGIRSLAVRGNRARVFAGAGIVPGSDPDREWEETEIKMRGILDALEHH